MTSLKDFSALTDVSLNASTLTGSGIDATQRIETLADILPPNLESLKIFGVLPDSKLEHLLRGLFGMTEALARGKFPKFKLCSLDIAQNWDGFGVVEELKKAGIVVNYGAFPLSEPSVLNGDWKPRTHSFRPMRLPEVEDGSDL
jgi:hypothetical protein